MCNHYRNNPEAMAEIPFWREYVAQLHLDNAVTDMWPGRGETWFRVASEDIAAFAGIWRPPTGPDGGAGRSVSVAADAVGPA